MLVPDEQVFALAIVHGTQSRLLAQSVSLRRSSRAQEKRPECPASKKTRGQQERKDKNVLPQWGRHYRGELRERKGN